MLVAPLFLSLSSIPCPRYNRFCIAQFIVVHRTAPASATTTNANSKPIALTMCAQERDVECLGLAVTTLDRDRRCDPRLRRRCRAFYIPTHTSTSLSTYVRTYTFPKKKQMPNRPTTANTLCLQYAAHFYDMGRDISRCVFLRGLCLRKTTTWLLCSLFWAKTRSFRSLREGDYKQTHTNTHTQRHLQPVVIWHMNVGVYDEFRGGNGGKWRVGLRAHKRDGMLSHTATSHRCISAHHH